MKLLYSISHRSGITKVVDTNDYSIGEVIAIYNFYANNNCYGYDLEVIYEN